MNDVPRYSTLPFPSYTYVPGSGTPHPVSDSRGHMHGVNHAIPVALDPLRWHDSETYLYSIDLFNHGFYWEAHEAWESLWHAAGHRGTIADFLKGLIKLAAAGVKFREGNSVGVQRHAERGRELLSSVSQRRYCGIDLPALIQQASKLEPEISEQFPLVIELASLPA
jgi:predicted metal-dependent hydrolase